MKNIYVNKNCCLIAASNLRIFKELKFQYNIVLNINNHLIAK